MSNKNNIWNIVSNVNESIKDDITSKDIMEKPEYSKNCIDKDRRNKCKGCGSYNLERYNNEKIICIDCNMVNSTIINDDKEWRYYGSNDNKSSDPNRCGMPINPLFSKSSLSVKILGNKCYKFQRMNNWNGLSYKDRKLIKILNKIKKIARNNHIPECVVDTAIILFKYNNEEQKKRGKKSECILGSCFRLALKYYSKKDININRSMEELSKIFKLKEKKLSREFNELFEVIYKKDPKFIKKIKPIEPKDLINRYCTLLNIDDKYIDICIYTVKLANKLGICQDNNPKSISVGIIYLICVEYKLDINKKLISSKCGTSEVTIITIYNQLNVYKKYILPSNL